jgi:hypothetical protein
VPFVVMTGYETKVRNGKQAVMCTCATGYCELPPFAVVVSGLDRMAQTFGAAQSVCEDDFVNDFPVAASSTVFASVEGAVVHG